MKPMPLTLTHFPSLAFSIHQFSILKILICNSFSPHTNLPYPHHPFTLKKSSWRPFALTSDLTNITRLFRCIASERPQTEPPRRRSTIHPPSITSIKYHCSTWSNTTFYRLAIGPATQTDHGTKLVFELPTEFHTGIWCSIRQRTFSLMLLIRVSRLSILKALMRFVFLWSVSRRRPRSYSLSLMSFFKNGRYCSGCWKTIEGGN